MEELVRHYGYWMVAAGTVVEGDATVVTAAFLAHRGDLSLLGICLLAGFATTIENMVLYELALRRGGALAAGTGKNALRIQKVLGWVRMRGAALLFVSRFLIGLRSAAAIACGIARMPRPLFLWTNLAGAVVWTAVMAAVGYSGGQLFAVVVDDVKRHEWRVAAMLAAGLGISVLWKTRGADILDAAVMIERWPIFGLLKRAKKTSQ